MSYFLCRSIVIAILACITVPVLWYGFRRRDPTGADDGHGSNNGNDNHSDSDSGDSLSFLDPSRRLDGNDGDEEDQQGSTHSSVEADGSLVMVDLLPGDHEEEDTGHEADTEQEVASRQAQRGRDESMRPHGRNGGSTQRRHVGNDTPTVQQQQQRPLAKPSSSVSSLSPSLPSSSSLGEKQRFNDLFVERFMLLLEELVDTPEGKALLRGVAI